MHIPRSIEPEWLDGLPPDDPRALRSRRDLRRVNALMRNTAIVAGELKRNFPNRSPRVIAELGAGDGTLMLRLAERMQWPGVHAVLLDQQDIVSTRTLAGFTALSWTAETATADVFEWLAQPQGRIFDVIVANLFLHHFDPARLQTLLSLAAQCTRVLIACEPRRARLALAGSRLLGIVGCNDVSRHDAIVSVRAGFAGCELSALWPAGPSWRLQERAQGVFSHCFVASRRDNND